MAYARTTYRRRRYAARPRKRTVYRRKTTYRRKRTTRVSRPLRKKILKVSAVKKQNSMASTNNANDENPIGRVTLPNYVNGFLWCPTYMNLEQGEVTPHARQRENVYFRGVQEKWTIANGEFADVYHRRVVFWHDARIEIAAPIQSSVSDTTFFRPLNLIDFSTGDGAILLRTLFKGTENIDWKNVLNASVDKARVRLVSDRIRKIRSTVAHSTLEAPTDARIMPTASARYNTPSFVNKSVRYDDEEVGAFDRVDDPPAIEPRGSPWATFRGGSSGNLYIFDLFSVNASSTFELELPVESNPPDVAVDSTVYWHEK